ncbi:hypothetical protein [Pseudomarimonas arenosa]|uniref:Lipoprotein n=1 Tax=Pseudomarimonas arenosa TaxID=2774145 RepID=A0AAW3ZRJ6_9GAMM|nr:hypothetical protein [Pseudomarimonas arenosa]MBD8528323.1 hypothetical protein [Pseudomarimonas arenosa]
MGLLAVLALSIACSPVGAEVSFASDQLVCSRESEAWKSNGEIAMCLPSDFGQGEESVDGDVWEVSNGKVRIEIVRGLDSPSNWGTVEVVGSISVLGRPVELLVVRDWKGIEYNSVYFDSMPPDGSSLFVGIVDSNQLSADQVKAYIRTLKFVNFPDDLEAKYSCDQGRAMVDITNGIGESSRVGVGDRVGWRRGVMVKLSCDGFEIEYFDSSTGTWGIEKVPVSGCAVSPGSCSGEK